MGQSKSTLRSRLLVQPQVRNVELGKPALVSQYIVQLPTLPPASKLDVMIESSTAAKPDTTVKPDAPRKAATMVRPATPGPANMPRRLTDLPNEILDLIFIHLDRSEHAVFLRNRATHGAAIRAIWSDIDLGLSLEQMLVPNNAHILTLTKGKLGKCLRVNHHHNLALTRRVSLYVDQVNDWTHLLARTLKACSNLLTLNIHLCGARSHLARRMPIPPTVRFLTVNRPDVLHWPAAGHAWDKESTSPPVPQLDQLTLRLMCHESLTETPVTEDSVWCNVRKFKFEMLRVASRESGSYEEQGSKSLREFDRALQYLVNDNASRASLRRLEFAPAGCIYNSRPWGMHNQDSLHFATILSMIHQLPSLEVLSIPVELLLPCLQTIPSNRSLTFEIPLKACDLESYWSQEKGINTLLSVKAFLDILPRDLESRRIKPLLDLNATDLSPRDRRRKVGSYAIDWRRWMHSRLEFLGPKLVLQYLRAAELRKAKLFYRGPGVEIQESLSLVALWLRRQYPKARGNKALKVNVMGDAYGDDALREFFDLVT